MDEFLVISSGFLPQGRPQAIINSLVVTMSTSIPQIKFCRSLYKLGENFSVTLHS